MPRGEGASVGEWDVLGSYDAATRPRSLSLAAFAVRNAKLSTKRYSKVTCYFLPACVQRRHHIIGFTGHREQRWATVLCRLVCVFWSPGCRPRSAWPTFYAYIRGSSDEHSMAKQVYRHRSSCRATASANQDVRCVESCSRCIEAQLTS